MPSKSKWHKYLRDAFQKLALSCLHQAALTAGAGLKLVKVVDEQPESFVQRARGKLKPPQAMCLASRGAR